MDNREVAGVGRGCREAGLVLGGLTAPPPIDCLFNDALARAVEGGGAIDGFPAVLSLDFVLESDVRAVVAGVPVRGVEVVEFVEDCAGFVGDFVGDWAAQS